MILAPTLSLSSGSGAAIVRPTFSRDFAGEKTLNNGTGPSITFTRASDATYCDADGVLRFAPNNHIRNSEAGGAAVGVIGGSGALPANWSSASTAAAAYEIIETGTEAGFAYIDVKISGTNSTGSPANPAIGFEVGNQIVAAQNQAWTSSLYVSLVTGSISGVASFEVNIVERDSSGNVLANNGTTFTPTATLTRFSHTRTMASASTGRVTDRIRLTVNDGDSYNLTLRIAAPQLERGPAATAYNPTTGTAYFGPRFDHSGGNSLGLLIEEARTNSIRNSQAGGSTDGVIGSGGVMPTNWFFGAATGITREVIGTGTDNGMAYVDVKFSGTNSTGSTLFPQITLESLTQIVAAASQTWTASAYVALVGGSLSGISVRINIQEGKADTTYLANSNTAFTPTASLARYSHTRTLTNALTERATPSLIPFIDNGATVDCTLRIAAPQLEQGAFPTSYIPTTTAAVTRATEVAEITSISSFYNQSEGTILVEGSVQTSLGLPALVSIDDATADERLQLRRNDSVSQASFNIADGGVAQAGILTGSWTTSSQVVKLAAAYKVDDFAVSAGGGAVATDTSGTLPTPTRLQIGRGVNSSVSNGHIRRIAYYPKRLSNALLQSLTT